MYCVLHFSDCYTMTMRATAHTGVNKLIAYTTTHMRVVSSDSSRTLQIVHTSRSSLVLDVLIMEMNLEWVVSDTTIDSSVWRLDCNWDYVGQTWSVENTRRHAWGHWESNHVQLVYNRQNVDYDCSTGDGMSFTGWPTSDGMCIVWPLGDGMCIGWSTSNGMWY